MLRWSFALLLASIFCGGSQAVAQSSNTKKEALPKPRKVELETKDGLKLNGFYFASNKGKEAIPVMIVHGWEGQINVYAKLCATLQKSGCAVFAFDYRGHGGSREYTDRRGKKREFDVKTMSKRDIGNIVLFDLESVKAFLKKENNEGNLNLNALVLVSVRGGCVLAANWAQRDWSFPSVGSRKQGQDVKALVLVSPERLLRGIPIDKAITDPKIASLPTMIIVGEGSAEESDADRITKRVEVEKKRMSPSREPEGLEVLKVKQSLGGPALVAKAPDVIPAIVKFITSEVPISDVDNPWIERN
ncbi:MAG: alpha/beta fold hydrolase [Planctomycetota bacterium]